MGYYNFISFERVELDHFDMGCQKCNGHEDKGYLHMLFYAWFYAHQRKWNSSNVFTEPLVWFRSTVVVHLPGDPGQPHFWYKRTVPAGYLSFSFPSVDSGDTECEGGWGARVRF